MMKKFIPWMPDPNHTILKCYLQMTQHNFPIFPKGYAHKPLKISLTHITLGKIFFFQSQEDWRKYDPVVIYWDPMILGVKGLVTRSIQEFWSPVEQPKFLPLRDHKRVLISKKSRSWSLPGNQLSETLSFIDHGFWT